MKLLIDCFYLIPIFSSLVAAGFFSCDGDDDKFCPSSFFGSNSTLGSVLGTFLGDHGSVIFQNDLVKNKTACPAMSVIFARGTLEPGTALHSM